MPERRPERKPERKPDEDGRRPDGGRGVEGRRLRPVRPGLGRRTTLAVACVLAVLGGPATVGGAYAAPLAPTAPAAPTAATDAPTPQPSPGVPPRPRQPRGGDGDSGGGPDRDARPGGEDGAGDDHWSTTMPTPETGGNDPEMSGDDPGASPGGVTEGDDDAEAGDGGAESLEDLRKRIQLLHDRAGSATDAYNAAEAKAKKQREKIDDLERRVESTRSRLAELRKQAGALARAQYRSGGLPAGAQLVLSEDPETFLRDAGLARQGHQAARSLVTSLSDTEERLDGYTRDAKKRYADLKENRESKAAAKKRIEKQLKKAERLESRLAADQRERLRELERQAAYARQLRWLRSGVLAEIDGKASAKGKRAIAYATAQIGKDYEWGAEGPTTYDCSGLTMRAWEAAGVTVPRTSQEQWRQLPRVDVADMRPGDLVIYKSDASHVGMYLGDGVMVHAPRTGRQITVEGAGSYPILGVVRPDK